MSTDRSRQVCSREVSGDPSCCRNDGNAFSLSNLTVIYGSTRRTAKKHLEKPVERPARHPALVSAVGAGRLRDTFGLDLSQRSVGKLSAIHTSGNGHLHRSSA